MRVSIRRESNDDSFLLKSIEYCGYWCGEVPIHRDYDCGVKYVIVSVAEKINRDVDICHLLLVGRPPRSTSTFFLYEIAFRDEQVVKRCKCLQVRILMPVFVWIIRIVIYAGGKVTNFDQNLLSPNQMQG